MIALASLRKSYSLASLDEANIEPNPLQQFDLWLKEALRAQLPEPNTMTLATVNERGQPSARIVLIKNVDARGFVFFTNYLSRKGRELAHNPQAALLFYWIELERQVRIEGRIEKISAAESDQYFLSRPLDSRLGAWASAQSEIIADRAQLDTGAAEVKAQYGDHPPRPPYWGGYRLVPQSIEFWQGRPSRLHDRLLYTQDATASPSGWRIVRLAP